MCIYTCIRYSVIFACMFTGMFPCVNLGKGPEVDVKMSSSAISSHFFSDRVPR